MHFTYSVDIIQTQNPVVKILLHLLEHVLFNIHLEINDTGCFSNMLKLTSARKRVRFVASFLF